MTREEARARFTAEVEREEARLELDRAALLIAAEEYPFLEVEAYIGRLDEIATAARRHDRLEDEPQARILALAEWLSSEMAFRGNAGNYYDVRNSFLHKVIDRRVGIPITLSVVHIEIARRLGLELRGVGMPGHFIVKCRDEAQEILLDPFNGGRRLTIEDCREMIEQMYGGSMPFRAEFLATVTKRQILTRMLQNLKSIYSNAKDYARTLAVIERVLLLNPDLTTEIRDRGLVNVGMGRYAQARHDLETYLRRNPGAVDATQIQERLNQLKQKQARLN
ncbi:MAG: transglutaminase-like domain-containing protein [Blastocatellia bacterium]|nr:transglutaminase-like domain-containing protein [Blastocatellia bacterium]